MPTESVGQRIRNRRQILGMTQRDLAARLEVSPSTVANWETSKHLPRRYIGLVEQVLGISLSGGEAEPPQQDDRPPMVRDNWDLDAVRGTWSDPLVERDAALGMIRWYLDSRELGRRRQNGPSR